MRELVVPSQSVRTPTAKDDLYTYDGLNRLAATGRSDPSGTYPNYTGVTNLSFAQNCTLGLTRQMRRAALTSPRRAATIHFRPFGADANGAPQSGGLRPRPRAFRPFGARKSG